MSLERHACNLQHLWLEEEYNCNAAILVIPHFLLLYAKVGLPSHKILCTMEVFGLILSVL